jgi:hypothetical protein
MLSGSSGDLKPRDEENGPIWSGLLRPGHITKNDTPQWFADEATDDRPQAENSDLRLEAWRLRIELRHGNRRKR